MTNKRWVKGKWTGVKFQKVGNKLISEPMTRKQYLSRLSISDKKKVLENEKK